MIDTQTLPAWTEIDRQSTEDEYHSIGRLYSVAKPLANARKPGPEWNTVDITLDGPRTIVVLKGEKLADFTESGPGLPSKFS